MPNTAAYVAAFAIKDVFPVPSEDHGGTAGNRQGVEIDITAICLSDPREFADIAVSQDCPGYHFGVGYLAKNGMRCVDIGSGSDGILKNGRGNTSGLYNALNQYRSPNRRSVRNRGSAIDH